MTYECPRVIDECVCLQERTNNSSRKLIRRFVCQLVCLLTGGAREVVRPSVCPSVHKVAAARTRGAAILAGRAL